jgi:hypothetical protein
MRSEPTKLCGCKRHKIFGFQQLEKEAAERKFCIEYLQVTGRADHESQARPVSIFSA